MQSVVERKATDINRPLKSHLCRRFTGLKWHGCQERPPPHLGLNVTNCSSITGEDILDFGVDFSCKSLGCSALSEQENVHIAQHDLQSLLKHGSCYRDPWNA